jgi:predicted membrane protein
MNLDLKYVALMIGFQIPHIVAVVFNGIYCFRKKTLDGILMLIGGVLGVFVGLAQLLLQFFLLNDRNNMEQYAYTMSGISILGLVFNILYTVGFILLMLKVSKTPSEHSSNRFDMIDSQPGL